MEFFKTNYTFLDYDKKELNLFDYDNNNSQFFFPLLFPSQKYRSIKYKNTYSVNTIRKYNLYYSLFFIVNKHIWNKCKYFNFITNELVEKIDNNTITIEEAIKYSRIPRAFYALKYVTLNSDKPILYENMDDDKLIKVVDSLIYFSNRLGILTSSNYKNTIELKLKIISEQSVKIENFLSLAVTVQLRLFIDWINKKTIIITGSTGIGKSKIMPKLLFYICLLFDGYSNYKTFNINDYDNSKDKKVLLALPRKLLVQSQGIELARVLNLNLNNNKLIKLQYKNIKDEGNSTAVDQISYYNISKEFKMIIATSQSLFQYIENASILICDEVHEHTVAIDNLIMIAKLINLPLVLISATIESDKDIIDKFFPEKSYINIKGDTLFSIKEIKELYINETNFTDKNLIIGSINTVIKKHINKVNRGENIIVFLPTVKIIEEVKKTINFNDAEILILHKDVKNYKKTVQEYAETSKKNKHIILSTPIAESSITIKFLKLVIDSGLFFNTDYGKQKNDLINYSSYVQRKGRVGRESNGYYVSLFNPEILTKELKKEIDGTTLFTTILYLFHYISFSKKKQCFDNLKNTTNLNILITKEDILKNYIFPPKNINRINKVYDYLKNKNFFNEKYTSLLVQGLTCSLIDYLDIYYKYQNTKGINNEENNKIITGDIFNELRLFEEDEIPIHKISNTLFKELYLLNKRIYYINGTIYYNFFNDESKSYKLLKNDVKKLINNKFYIMIKYNKVLICNL
jgi:TusA-related sulfurtransferase